MTKRRSKVDEDAREVFEVLVGDATEAWGVPTWLEDDGWTEARYERALARLRQIVAGEEGEGS